MLEEHLMQPPRGLALRYFVDLSRIEAALKGGMDGIPSEVPLRSFVRMLCKIAHCSAVAEYGLDGFEPLLCEVIRGDAHDWSQFVEAEAEVQPNDCEYLHTADFFTNGRLLVVAIRLFASIGAPHYSVVTGRVDGPQFQRGLGE
jgi:hypothetical protein